MQGPRRSPGSAGIPPAFTVSGHTLRCISPAVNKQPRWVGAAIGYCQPKQYAKLPAPVTESLTQLLCKLKGRRQPADSAAIQPQAGFCMRHT